MNDNGLLKLKCCFQFEYVTACYPVGSLALGYLEYCTQGAQNGNLILLTRFY